MATCPNCSADATGAYCSACGAVVAEPAAGAPSAPVPPVETTAGQAPIVPPPTTPPYQPPSPPPTAPPCGDPVGQPTAEHATWLRRVGGSVIDAVVFGVPMIALVVAGFAWGFSTMHWRCVQQADGSSSCHSLPGSTFSAGGGVLLGLAALWAVAWTIYLIVAIGGPRGATVGMRAVRIRCVRDVTFDQVGMGKSFLRLLVTWLLGILWVGSLIDDLFPLWDQKRQTLHDKAVETVVLRTPA